MPYYISFSEHSSGYVVFNTEEERNEAFIMNQRDGVPLNELGGGLRIKDGSIEVSCHDSDFVRQDSPDFEY